MLLLQLISHFTNFRTSNLMFGLIRYIVHMNSETKLSAFPFLLFLSNLIAFGRAQSVCGSNGNYTRDSAYQANLNALLSSLSTDIPDNGFFPSYEGRDPDRVNGIALCRGDVQLDFCRSCVRNASYEVQNSCPSQRDAFVWSEYCTLRYSNQSIFGSLAIYPGNTYYNVENATSPVEFMADLRFLLASLRDQASDGGSFRKLAAGNRSTYGSATIFGLVQCTPDLTREDCSSCLIGAEKLLSDSARGGAVLVTSCNLRYELNERFYNQSRIQELTLPRIPPSPVPNIPSRSGNAAVNKTTRTIIITVVLVALGVILVIFAGFLLQKRNHKQRLKDVVIMHEIGFDESLQCDFGKIRAATNDFSDANKLGRGGFGSVYKGVLQNNQEIAVKKLSKDSGQGDLEFKNEVMLLARLQHRNLVKLLGFSVEGNEKLLVYEFVKNASLDNFLFDQSKRSRLDWDKRYKIIEGIAKGILYLHQDSRLRIIHRDLKASNVLLDEHMNPKIADFGLARLFVPDETQGSTCRIVGTYGYMAPEYAMHGQFSVKSDVFSFGVLLLEIISGRKNSCSRNEDTVDHLLSSAWLFWREGTIANLIDPVLISEAYNIPNILRCIHIGLLCVQENIVHRPTMTAIVQMLNSPSITLAVPSKPSFFMVSGHGSTASNVQESKSEDEISHKSKNSEIANCDLSSQNEMSITELCPR